jgi:hypothetical protein
MASWSRFEYARGAPTLHTRSLARSHIMMILTVEACMMLIGRLAISSASTPANTEMRFGAHVHETEAEESSATPADSETCRAGDGRDTIQAASTPASPHLSSMRTDYSCENVSLTDSPSPSPRTGFEYFSLRDAPRASYSTWTSMRTRPITCVLRRLHY